MVAVTTGGAVVVLNPRTGAVARTLVASGALGREIAVSPGGSTVYFTVSRGCTNEIDAVPVAGGTPAVIAAGALPAISPDGTRLAFAREPLDLPAGCHAPIRVSSFSLAVRTLSTGGQVAYPMAAPGTGDLPFPISYLSWAPDGRRLAVSVSAPQDNEGWSLVVVDTASARFYLSGPGTTVVPVTGSPDARESYYRAGLFMPDGNLFANRVCCTGWPVHTTSSLMWKVYASGVLIHQVATGIAGRVHSSLGADATGRWLLYLSGTDLYVSHDGATPALVASGLSAAAWG